VGKMLEPTGMDVFNTPMRLHRGQAAIMDETDP